MVPDASTPWLLLLMLGVMVPVFAHHLWLWRVSHNVGVHAWAAAWVGTAALFLIGCIVQTSAPHPAAHIGERLQDASVVLLLPCAMFTIAALFRRSVPGWLRRALVLGTLTCVLLLSFTGWIIEPISVERRGFGDAVLPRGTPGVLYPLFLVYGTTMGAIIFRTLSTSRVEVWSSRKITLAMVALFIALGLNDALITLGLIRSLPLLHFGFFGLAIAISYVANRRVVALYTDMEGAVAERTRALHENERDLERLVARLRSSEARFRSLSDATSEAVFFHVGGRIVDVNAAAASMFRTSAAELVGRPIATLVSGEPDVGGCAPHAQANLERTAQREGATFPVEIARGRVPGHESEILTVRDVTEQKQMQARMVLADRVASLGTLAAGAAHEINNPLSYVVASLETLRDALESKLDAESLTALDAVERPRATPTAEWIELVREALHGCQRVAAIVRELRSLSRGDDADRVPVRVVDAFESAIRMTRSELHHRARLVRDFAGDPWISANPGRFGQVLVNLLINAAQAIPEGASESHEIRVGAHTTPAGTVVIEVADTGVGIPEDQRARIFDPFVTSKPIGQGTGLGLSVCHSIVSALNGVIEVESELGRGTTFRVELSASSHAADDRSSGTQLVAENATARMRVLVVDDEEMVGRALARMLSEHDVTIALSGARALDLLRTGEFELVMCDLMMPGVSGVDLYEAIARERPELLERIVFVTGGAFTERAKTFLERVPNPRLDKPFSMASVRQIAADACAKWQHETGATISPRKVSSRPP